MIKVPTMSVSIFNPVSRPNHNHNSESIFVEIDDCDYKFACEQTITLYKSVVDNLKSTFKYYSYLKFEKNQFDFKIFHKDTNNGIHICIPPYNTKTIELYYIINNKKNYKKIILLDIDNPNFDIIKIIRSHMFNNEVQKDRINNVYDDMSPLFTKYKNTFKVIRNDYNISFVEISTNNGYNFYIDLEKSNYVSVRIIQNDNYYDRQKYNVSMNNMLIAHKYIIDSISQNKHNVPIVVYRIVRCNLMGTDVLNTMILDASQNILTPSSSSTISSVDTSMDGTSDCEYDPIDV
jgi:hypothetical protein